MRRGRWMPRVVEEVLLRRIAGLLVAQRLPAAGIGRVRQAILRWIRQYLVIEQPQWLT